MERKGSAWLGEGRGKLELGAGHYKKEQAHVCEKGRKKRGKRSCCATRETSPNS